MNASGTGYYALAIVRVGNAEGHLSVQTNPMCPYAVDSRKVHLSVNF